MAEITDEELKKKQDELAELKKKKQDARIWNKAEVTRCYKAFSRYILIGEGGKPRVVDTEHFNRWWSVADAKVYFQDFTYKEAVVRQNKLTGKITTDYEPHEFIHQWLHRTRRFDEFEFDPKIRYGSIREQGKYIDTFRYNKWRGFFYKPDKSKSADLFYKYLKEYICNDSQATYDYVLDWMAQLFQEPEVKNNISLVLSSQMQGSGKSVFGAIIAELCKPYSKTIGSDELYSRFNDFMRDKIFIFVDENMFFQKRSTWNKLKKLVSDSETNVEEKGVNMVTVPNYMRFLFAANEDISIAIETDNRRYQPIKCAERKLEKVDRDAMIDQLEHGGYERLMWDLAKEQRDISTIVWAPKILDQSYVTNRINTLHTEHPSWMWLLESATDDTQQDQNAFVAELENKNTHTTFYSKSNSYFPSIADLYDKYSRWCKSVGIYQDSIGNQYKFYTDVGAILDVGSHGSSRKKDCRDTKIPLYRERLAKNILGSKDDLHWLFSPDNDAEFAEQEEIENKKALSKLHFQVLDQVEAEDEKELEQTLQAIDRVLYQMYIKKHKDQPTEKLLSFIEWKERRFGLQKEASEDRKAAQEARQYKEMLVKFGQDQMEIVEDLEKKRDESYALYEAYNQQIEKILEKDVDIDLEQAEMSLEGEIEVSTAPGVLPKGEEFNSNDQFYKDHVSFDSNLDSVDGQNKPSPTISGDKGINIRRITIDPSEPTFDENDPFYQQLKAVADNTMVEEQKSEEDLPEYIKSFRKKD
jgi:flagellar hook-basal body complex protein FliE